jgi:hypothetical protein
VPISTGTLPCVTLHAPSFAPARGVENREGVVDTGVTVEEQIGGHAGHLPQGSVGSMVRVAENEPAGDAWVSGGVGL